MWGKPREYPGRLWRRGRERPIPKHRSITVSHHSKRLARHRSGGQCRRKISWTRHSSSSSPTRTSAWARRATALWSRKPTEYGSGDESCRGLGAHTWPAITSRHALDRRRSWPRLPPRGGLLAADLAHGARGVKSPAPSPPQTSKNLGKLVRLRQPFSSTTTTSSMRTPPNPW